MMEDSMISLLLQVMAEEEVTEALAVAAWYQLQLMADEVVQGRGGSCTRNGPKEDRDCGAARQTYMLRYFWP